ncbi:MAG: glycosyltransferase family 9 protein [Bacteriovoracaceae bacterium]
MKDILIINLKRFGDITLSTRLAYSLAGQGHNVHFLCFKEFSGITNIMNPKINFHYIDRKRIEFILKSQLVNDHLAIDELKKTINELKEYDWDEIHNLSNDKIASRIIPTIMSENTKVRGVQYRDNELIHSGSWEIYFNNIANELTTYPVSLHEIFFRLSGHKDSTDSTLFTRSASHEETVLKNFEKIRQKFSSYGNDIRLMGITPFSSSREKDISSDEVVSTIEALKARSPYIIPILIHAPIQAEKNAVKEILEKLNNNLITIECDFAALVSVVENIDLLFSTDSLFVHMANVLKTPVICVSNGPSPTLFQGTLGASDLILCREDIYANHNTRSATVEESTNTNWGEAYSQIITSHVQNPREINSEVFEELGINAVIPSHTQDGFVSYKNISLKPNHKDSQMLYVLQRNFFLKMLTATPINMKEITEELKKHDGLESFITEEKEKILNVTKKVLNCLRVTKVQGQNSSTIINHMSEIFSFLDNKKSLLYAPICYFYVECSQAPAVATQEEKLKYFEFKLFNLKNNIQALFQFLKDIEVTSLDSKNQSTVNRHREQRF